MKCHNNIKIIDPQSQRNECPLLYEEAEIVAVSVGKNFSSLEVLHNSCNTGNCDLKLRT